MTSLKDKAMAPMFWIGASLTSMCSWLLAVAVVGRVVLDRPLTSAEKVFSLASAVGFAVVVVFVLWRKVQKISETSI